MIFQADGVSGLIMQQRLNSGKSAAILLLICLVLSSCADPGREARLRFWEKSRIASEQAMNKHRFRTASSLAEEAVCQSRGFGAADFRLGVSLCHLGDALRAEHKTSQSESAYRQAEAVLRAALKKAEPALAERVNAGSKSEKEMNEMLYRLIQEDLANTLFHLAVLYMELERNPDAYDCFEKASWIYQAALQEKDGQINDGPLGQEQVQCLIGLARVSTALKKYDLSDDSYRRALDLAVAANCPEFMLCEIRNAYLKLLQQVGRKAQANQLVADETYARFTSAGIKALFAKDFAAAEALFRQAYACAQQSVFCQRRLMRALFNLQNVYYAEHKCQEMEQIFAQAGELMQATGPHFDKDFDRMLTTQAVYCLQEKRAEQSVAVLEEQLRYRLLYYGCTSIEICHTYAMKGQAEMQSNKTQAANTSAGLAYRLIHANHMTNRRAADAIAGTAQLMEKLNHFKEAEIMYKQLVDNRLKRMDVNDLRVIGNEAALFHLYYHFRKHEQALHVSNDIAYILQTGTSRRRGEAMPYLAFIQFKALSADWYDVAEPVTKVGQLILHDDLAGVPLAPMNQTIWRKGLARMEQYFGRKF